MRRAPGLVFLAVLMAAGTWLAGWWAVPVLAGLWGAWGASGRAAGQSAGRPPGHAPAAAALAWAGLLGLDASRGPLAVVAQRAAGAMGVPAVALVVLTLSFAALSAWSVAFVAAALVRWARGERGTSRRVEDPAARASSAA